ncbi:TPA: EbsA family protein [Streptococcus suis]|uniref:EbsA family protein n=1 Tax=Streptococcus suis TaxID=1307 RepID=UPI0015581187|nr:EbsA family protein [Streptococcus suis]NQJ67752.1 EbsA family protein [Streptococcus suis]NQJ75879.1 EbsA family protein [Streptococcus suis]
MIKIFGKIRYHWQPELSFFIIYWSLTFTPLFLGLSLLLESLHISSLSIVLISVFLVFSMLGMHRYFEIKEDSLKITAANPFGNHSIKIETISKIEVTYLSISIISTEFPDGITYYMRKWPKKYFVNHLGIHPHFSGEVVLTDHLIKQDYFEEYYSEKAKSLK